VVEVLLVCCCATTCHAANRTIRNNVLSFFITLTSTRLVRSVKWETTGKQ
jgi:hypothetical protein